MARAQVPLAAIEAGIGVVLLLTLTMGFALGVAPATSDARQLEAYAADAITILENEAPQHGESSRLAEVVASPSTFEREQEALRRRTARILPANVFFRLETAHGTVGHRLPADVPTGTATVATEHGPVTIRVWYA